MKVYLEVEKNYCNWCELSSKGTYEHKLVPYCSVLKRTLPEYDSYAGRSPDCLLKTLDEINREAEEREAGLRREEAQKTGEEVVGAIKAWVDAEPYRPENMRL